MICIRLPVEIPDSSGNCIWRERPDSSDVSTSLSVRPSTTSCQCFANRLRRSNCNSIRSHFHEYDDDGVAARRAKVNDTPCTQNVIRGIAIRNGPSARTVQSECQFLTIRSLLIVNTPDRETGLAN